jgi:DNA-binding NtrC family response regulator/tetratricopeptide (TPR) repeat protein
MTDETLRGIQSTIRAGKLSDALALAEVVRRTLPSREPSIEIARAELLQFTGRNDEARVATEALKKTRHTPELKARCEMILGRICLEQEDPARSTRHFQTCIRLARSAGEMNLVCFAQSKLLTTLADISTPHSTLGLLRETEKNILASGDPQAGADFHTRVAQIAATQGDYSRAQRHLREARLLLSTDNNAWLEGSLNLSASAIHLLAFELDLARHYASEALRCAGESGHARTRMAATANMALLELHLGHLESAGSHLEGALQLSKRFSVSQISLLDSCAQLQLAQGHSEESERLLGKIDEQISIHEPSVTSWQQLAVGPTRLRSLLASEESTGAAALAAELVSIADDRSDRLHQISLRVLGADALMELGRLEEAAAYINAASALSEEVPVAIFAEVERVRATLIARTTGRDAARRQFERALRLLSAVGGIAPRIDAARSYQRVMHPDSDRIRRAVETQPWNLGSLIDPTLPGRTRNATLGAPAAGHEHCGTDMTDVVALGRLVSRPDLMAQEAFVLLRESGHMAALAIVERTDGGTPRIVAHEGWSAGQARRATTRSNGTVIMPLGETAGREYDLLARPQDTVRAHSLLHDLRSFLQQTLTLETVREAERAQYSLMSTNPPLGNEDGIFVSESMKGLVATAKQVAKTPHPILIVGETGTGKEVVARLIHKYSDRANRDFVPHNCAGVPKDLVESQLFGHRRGAFTGAREDSQGVIRAATGGTLLLDEIGDLELETQPKLLRFLENSEIQPLGESRPVEVDVRVIAATNAKLEELVRDGLFREDLLYRLNIITLEIPPLRARREEILPLVQHFLQHYGEECGRPDIRITEDAQKCLLLYEWPGNVRRLKNEIRRAIALAGEEPMIGLEQLSPDVIRAGHAIARTVESSSTPENPAVTVDLNQPLGSAVEKLEAAMIRWALDEAGGHVGSAAHALGVSRKGFYLKRQRLGIDFIH